MLLVPPLFGGFPAAPSAPPLPGGDALRLGRRIDRVAAQLAAGPARRDLRQRRAASATIEAYLRERRRQPPGA
jgi:hypothetical protein